MRPRVVIHVGPPKTGTTFMQRRVIPKLPGVFDAYNRSHDFMTALRDALVMEHPLRVSLEGLRRSAAALLQECGNDTLLISWEGLFGSEQTAFANNGQVAEGLKALFPESRIILSVRRQDAYAESAYRQALHTYRSVSPARFVGWQGSGAFRRRVFADYLPFPGLDVASLDWTPYIDNYIRLFGRDSVKVLVYERLRSEPDAYIREFCEFVGCEPCIPDKITEENRGYSILSCWIARGLNRLVYIPHQQFGIIPWRPFHDALVGRAKGRDIWWALAGISRRIDLRWLLQEGLDRLIYIPGHPIPAEVRRAIMAVHREANRALDERFGLGLQRYGYF